MSDLPAKRRYFSERQGRGPRARSLTLDELKRLVASVWDDFSARDYMQEAFGYDCVDAGNVDGYLGYDPGAYFLRVLNRDDVWPWLRYIDDWDEDTLLDMVETTHDLVAKPLDGRYHDYSGCGWHYDTFDRESGRGEYRTEINDVLSRWETAYELTDRGELLLAAPAHFAPMLAAAVPDSAHPQTVAAKVNNAIGRFRARGSTMEERRIAVRDLADVLEVLRPDVQAHMTKKDERALFDIANNFHIRHNNAAQLRDYDINWLTWIFYFYLATIHALLRTIERAVGDPER